MFEDFEHLLKSNPGQAGTGLVFLVPPPPRWEAQLPQAQLPQPPLTGLVLLPPGQPGISLPTSHGLGKIAGARGPKTSRAGRTSGKTNVGKGETTTRAEKVKSMWKPAPQTNTQVSEGGGRGAAPGARAEIPLQPLREPCWSRYPQRSAAEDPVPEPADLSRRTCDPWRAQAGDFPRRTAAWGRTHSGAGKRDEEGAAERNCYVPTADRSLPVLPGEVAGKERSRAWAGGVPTCPSQVLGLCFSLSKCILITGVCFASDGHWEVTALPSHWPTSFFTLFCQGGAVAAPGGSLAFSQG